jgi:P-type Na+/K+ transporter
MALCADVRSSGDVVPADARLLPGFFSNLECDEAILTGESLPVGKNTEPLDERECPIGDRLNMIYSGSQVTKGRARAVVTMTGMTVSIRAHLPYLKTEIGKSQTELGKIAEALGRKEKSTKTGFAQVWERVKVFLGMAGTTPLQIKMNKLAYVLLTIAIILAIIVVSSTGYRNIPDSIATYAVAAAVSILPASLVAVISLTLAVACRDLAARNALVRRMDAVETIGGVTDICSDKTGTITVGRMVLKKVWVPRFSSHNGDGNTYTVDSAQE